MEKTAKITRTTFKQKWSPSTGTGSPVFYHDIELDNGDKGSIGAKEEMPAKLNPGSTLTYTIDGNKIKAVSQSGGFQNGGGKFQPDPKVQVASFAASYAKDLLVAGRIEARDLEHYFERFHKMITSKI